jgi:hypothetical protein
MRGDSGPAARSLRIAHFLLQIGFVVNGACFFAFYIYLARVRPSAPIGAYTIEMSNHGDLYFVSLVDAVGSGLLAAFAAICLLVGLWAQRRLRRAATL